MIEAKELRVGNIITSKSSSLDYWEVSPSDIEQIFDNPSHYFPIPLTKYWLEIRLGAKQVNSKSGLSDSYKLAGIKFEVSNSGNVYHSQTKKPIPYVHKLQNLIYELKDIELTLNKEA